MRQNSVPTQNSTVLFFIIYFVRACDSPLHVSVICSLFVCVVPLSQPSGRDLVYPLLGCFVSEKSSTVNDRLSPHPRISPPLE